MKQYSLFMCVARTLISWTASHILVVWSITMVDHVKKYYDGLAWPTVLWTHSPRVSGVVSTCADGQRKIQIFKSLVIPVLLCGCETSTLNTDLKKQIDVFGNKCLCSIIGYRWNDCVKSATAP